MTKPHSRFASAIGILFFILSALGCEAPGSSDTNDLARLTMLDISTAVSLVNADQTCGFESPTAIANQQITGSPGTDGKVVRTVKDCVVEVRDNSGQYPFFKCDTNAGTARGKVKFSGTRTMSGRITHDSSKPIIPSTSDALTIVIESAQLDGFEVLRKDKAGSVTINGGIVKGAVNIALAAGKADGLCQAPTPNAQLQDISFTDVDLHFSNLLQDKDYVVSSGLLQATNGKVHDVENQLKGMLVIDGQPTQIPAAGAKPEFDPEYSKQRFESTFACPAGDVQLPVSYECADISESIAINTARISVLTLLDLINLVENDRTCGFSSDIVKNAKVTSGAVGSPGTITYTATNCTIAVPKPIVIGKDCQGAGDTVSGSVTLSAKKVLRGTITNDPATPFLPLTDSPITFEITASSLKDFSVINGARQVHVSSGSLTGEMVPRVAKSTNYGFCQVPTRTAELNHVRFSNGRVRIKTASGTIEGTVEQSDLSAVSGEWKGKENVLSGSISTNGQTFMLPTSPQTGAFDTAYDAETHAAKWQCDPSLARPVSYDCSAELPVPETVARLSVGMFGKLTEYLEKDTECGFSSESVKTAARSSASVGDIGTTTFSVVSCRKVFSVPLVDRDCNNQTASVSGTITFNATKRMEGYNTGLLSRQVVPTKRDAVTFEVSLDLDDVTYTAPSGQGPVSLKLDGVRLSGTATPRLAMDTVSNTCSKPLPITTFTNVTFNSPTNIGIGFPGLSYQALVQTMRLAAQSGSKDGVVNTISGRLNVSGEDFSFPINGSSALDPDYDSVQYQKSYECRADLQNTRLVSSDAECDFKQELALQTARYLPMLVESIAKVVSKDTACGLNIADGQLDPNSVSGRVGQTGSATWTAPHRGAGTCNFTLRAQSPVDTDCNGRDLIMEGPLNVSARLTIPGTIADQRGTTYVNPTRPDAPTEYTFNVAALNNLKVSEVEANGTPVQSLFVQSGNLAVVFNPIMALKAESGFTYLSATPVNRFKQIALTGSTRITLGIKGMNFNAMLSDAMVSGFSGAHNGEANRVKGSLTIDGRRFSEMAIDVPLDPDYNQTTFDNRYRCRRDIRGTVPVNFP